MIITTTRAAARYKHPHPVETGGEVSRQLHQRGDLAHRVRIGVGLAVGLLQGCDHAGITVADHGRDSSGVGSDDLAARAGVIQHEVGAGPWMDGARPQNRMLFVPDLSVDRRWPQWATRMRQELGVQAVLSLLLYTHDQSVGVLNLYADHAGAFSTKDFDLVRDLATDLAVAIADGQEIAHRSQQMSDRTVLGQAEGMLMQRYGIGAEEAVAMLDRVCHGAGRTPLQAARSSCAPGPCRPLQPPTRAPAAADQSCIPAELCGQNQ